MDKVFICEGKKIEVYNSKKELFEMFFSDFYRFILANDGKKDLESHNINSLDEFLKYADYYADGQENCYAMGFAFHKYFLIKEEGGVLENQPETTFIGYCIKNGKYVDFINFLISFFAFWRNDEHCTSFNPYNYADNFFTSAWAALVDTCKLFYFTAETVYWWQSFRVKYCLDNIPGVILIDDLQNNKIRIAGYEVLSVNNEDDNILIDLKRKDIYNYWEKEEKTIIKVYDPNHKKPDPA